jgi:hypothetical protein
LFEVEAQHRDGLAGQKPGVQGNGKGHVERFWLCGQCAPNFVLKFDRQRGLVLEDGIGKRKGVAAEVIEQSKGKGFPGLIVRPVDFNFPVVRS